jgi:hypothetical protein
MDAKAPSQEYILFYFNYIYIHILKEGRGILIEGPLPKSRNHSEKDLSI